MNAVDPTAGLFDGVADASKRVALRIFGAGENRIELLLLELQEERERFFQAMLTALGIAAFGLMAGIVFTLAIVLLFWERSPFLGIGLLLVVYGGVTGLLFGRLNRLRQNWHSFSATIEQLRKDCQCLANDTR